MLSDRFCYRRTDSRNNYEVRADALQAYRSADEKRPFAKSKRVTKDIRRVHPEDHFAQPDKLVFGYVQDYVENHADRLLQELGNVGQQHLRSALGWNRSQITIVTNEFESYTAFADLRNIVVKKKDILAARLKAVRVLSIPKTKVVFLCTDILSVHGNPVS